MSASSHALSPEYSEYLQRLSLRSDEPALQALREATRPLELALMQISPEQGQFMRVLCSALGVRRAIEVGVFTGYSTLCVALALPQDGRLVALDISEEWTAIAREHWEMAQVADRIDLRLAPASESLAAMLTAGEAGSYDFAFIDADKEGYPKYYQQCLELLRPGGVMCFDNAFMDGRVLEASPKERGPRLVQALNEQAFDDERVDASILPIGDGLLLVHKR
ncbi:MAG: methyltransferase [Planctomycetota bacterium]|nr:MAG: methyltransferase [Planctomycetota bacterium]